MRHAHWFLHRPASLRRRSPTVCANIKKLGLKHTSIFGGISYVGQMKALKVGLIWLLKRRAVSLIT